MANANKFFDFLRSYLTPAGKRAAWNLSWMLLGRLVGHVSLLGAVLLLTHALSGEQFGMVTTALAVQGYILLLGSAGMPAVVVREAVQRPQELSQIGATYLLVSWTIGGAAAAIAIFAVMLMPLSTSERWLLALMFFGAAAAAGNPEALYDALHSQAVPAIVFAVSDGGFLIAVVLMIWRGDITLPLLGALFLAKWVLSIGTLVLVLLAQNRFSFRDAKLGQAIRLWRSSWPLLVAGFLAMIPVSGGTIITRFLYGTQEAG
ncbi:MAG: oligosaccharide flippase family protein, partial [Thermogutta sp.]